MAIQNINFNPKPEKGVSYSAITDSSVDWTGITNGTYFYDKASNLPYYKNSGGTVVSLFEEGGGGGSDTFVTGGTYSGSTIILNRNDGNSVNVTGITSSNIYTADGILSGTRSVNLGSNVLTFLSGNTTFQAENGTSNDLSEYIARFRNSANSASYGIIANDGYFDFGVGNAISNTDFSTCFQLGHSNSINSTSAYFGLVGRSNTLTGSGNYRYILGSGNNTSSGNEQVIVGVDNTVSANYTSMIGSEGTLSGQFSSAIGRAHNITHQFVFGAGAWVQSGAQGASIIGHGVEADKTQKLVNSTANSLALGWNSTTPQHLFKSNGAELGGKVEMTTTTDGVLLPRLTTAQKNAISSPDTNLMVFDTDLSSLQRYNGSAWVAVAAGTGIVQLNQEGSSGDPVFYTDVQSALNAANTSGGDITITLHDNITTTAAISTNLTTNIDNITFDLNGFTITNTANDSTAVIYNKLQSNIIRIINGSIIKTTGTGHGIHLATGTGDLYMSNCYVYSEAGSALRVDASITPINIWELGGATFKTNTGYGVYLSDALGGVSLTNFISISTGSGMACFLNAGGDVTNFKAIAEGTGVALRVRGNITSATNFYAESNSGNCILLESLNPIIKDFTAISVSGYAVFSSASAYKIENFYVKTTSGTRTIQAPANSILINGDVFSDSTDCAFIADAERVENVNFTTNSGNYAVLSRFTTNWINCTFRNKDGVAFYNYNSSTSKLKKCTFISEKTSGGSAHAANIVDGASVITFVNCDFEVADSTVNCIKADAAMDMKVANCSFDGSATPLSSNITLNHLESDAFGNVTT